MKARISAPRSWAVFALALGLSACGREGVDPSVSSDARDGGGARDPDGASDSGGAPRPGADAGGGEVEGLGCLRGAVGLSGDQVVTRVELARRVARASLACAPSEAALVALASELGGRVGPGSDARAAERRGE